MDGEKMEITLNGAPRGVRAGDTVSALLTELGFDGAPVLVEHNGAPLFPRDFPETALAAGDQVELIRIVAGG